MSEQKSIQDLITQEASVQEQLGKRGGAFTTEMEAKQYSLLLNDAPRTVLDIGGNQGDYTKWCRHYYPDAEIVIVEPSSDCIPLLQKKFKADPRIRVENCAVGSEAGEGTLFANTPGSALGSLYDRDLRHINMNFDAIEKVKIRTVDLIAEEYFPNQSIDLIKLDVEGAELFCLQGASKTMTTCKAVQFEFGGCNIDSRTYLRDFYWLFEDLGFRLYRISPNGLIHLRGYREHLESFMTSNYLAVNAG